MVVYLEQEMVLVPCFRPPMPIIIIMMENRFAELNMTSPIIFGVGLGECPQGKNLMNCLIRVHWKRRL